MEILGLVNWLAVIIGAFAAFMVGYFWYSPMLFGEKWAKGSGVEMGTASNMPVMAMVTQFLGLLLLALVIGMTAVSEALFTAIVAILATAVLTFSMGAFVKKSNYALFTDLGYIIVSGIVMIAAQGLL